MNRTTRLCAALGALSFTLISSALGAQEPTQQEPPTLETLPPVAQPDPAIKTLRADIEALRKANEDSQKERAEFAKLLAESEVRAISLTQQMNKESAELKQVQPNAGFSNGHFYLQSTDGQFVLMPGGRLQIDAYAFSPAFEGPGQQGATVLIRRARPELRGVLFGGKIAFMLAGDFATPPNGVAATDVFVDVNIGQWFRLRAGQFDIPFTLSNQTSDNFLPFMERSFAVRNLAPAPKEPGVMVFGGAPNSSVFYSLGVFNGSGTNRANADNAFDLIGRAFIRPLVGGETLPRLQIGASAAYGRRVLNNTPYVGGHSAAGWLNTASRWAFFRTRCAGADGNGTTIGLVPEGEQLRVAGEFRIPMNKASLTSEFIHMEQDVGENVLSTGVALRPDGNLTGTGGHLTLDYWLLGDARVLPDPGTYPNPLTGLEDGHPQSIGLQLVGRGEYLTTTYDVGADSGRHVLGGSQIGGDYQVTSAAVGVNLWLSGLVRFSLGYAYYGVEGDNANLPSPDQRHLHEFSSRLAIIL